MTRSSFPQVVPLAAPKPARRNGVKPAVTSRGRRLVAAQKLRATDGSWAGDRVTFE